MRGGGAKRVFRKGGGRFCPSSPSPESPEIKIGGKIKNKRRWFRKCSLRVRKKDLH
jgi:hypothetical protein